MVPLLWKEITFAGRPVGNQLCSRRPVAIGFSPLVWTLRYDHSLADPSIVVCGMLTVTAVLRLLATFRPTKVFVSTPQALRY
jgi:hypothetical protein